MMSWIEQYEELGTRRTTRGLGYRKVCGQDGQGWKCSVEMRIC